MLDAVLWGGVDFVVLTWVSVLARLAFYGVMLKVFLK